MQGIFLIFLSCVTFIAFLPCLQAVYLRWDDTKHIIANVHVYLPIGLLAAKKIFSSFINNTYIPLTTLSFHWQYHAFNLHPFTSHLMNVLGHISIVLLVYAFTVRLGLNERAAAIAAGIFALHPMHVESIAWATERKDILCAFFYLLSLISYQEYLRSTKRYFYGLSLSFGILSILSKAMAVSLPWVLLLLDWHHKGYLKKERLLAKIPFALIIFPVAALTFFQLDGHPAFVFPDSLLIFIWSAGFYIEKFFWPYPLLPLYSPDYPVTLHNPVYWIAAAIIGTAFAAVWFYRKNKHVLFGALFFLSTIFFFFRVDLADINVVADRFMYVPSIGLCIILGNLLSKTHKAIPITFCAILFILTFFQCRVWQNDSTVWAYVLKHQPYNKIAQEKYRQALRPASIDRVDYQHFDQMLQRVPDLPKSYLKRGNDLAASGDFTLALDDYNTALKLNPKMEEAYINRGSVLQTHGDLALAMDNFDQAIALNPNSSALLSKAILLGNAHQFEPALSFFQLALKTNKDTDRALYERGYFYMINVMYPQAIADFSAAIIHHPEYTESYYQRGLCALHMDNIDQAGSDFARVTMLQPDNDQAFGQLCRVDLKQQQLSKAVKDCSKAIGIFNYDADYYNDRARAYYLLGKHAQALADMDQVITLEPQNIQARMVRNQIGQFVNSK